MPPLTLFLNARNALQEPYPTLLTANGIPLLAAVWAPAAPLDIGTQVRVRIIGSRLPEHPNNALPCPPHATMDAGIEGTVIAARMEKEDVVEILVRNTTGWAKPKVVAVIAHAIRGITVAKGLWDGLLPMNAGDKCAEEMADGLVKTYPSPTRGSGALEIPVETTAYTHSHEHTDETDGWWACREELTALGRTLGGRYHTTAKGDEGREAWHERRWLA